MSATSIPLGDAPALRGTRDRTRAIRLLLAAWLVGVAIAAFFASRGPDLSPTPLLPPGSSGVIVLDLSISVENGTLNRMYTGLTQLAATRDRFGLVLFSSRAYEALPPNTPASELRPFARFFHGTVPTRRSGAYQQLGEPPPNGNAFASQQRSSLVSYPANPWACCFSFGTEISDGLKLAQSLVTGPNGGRRAVWLMSDLADDPADRAVVAQVARSYAHDGIALHVIGLNPKPADAKYFESLLGARGTMIVGRPSTDVRLSTKHGFPIWLAVAGGVLALLLTVNELLSTPLRWGRAEAG
jgi:hypothetical protein